jgi:carbonic anhydrase/acetyltransferase-like protein (isoleucine patch superfamily)
MGSTLLDEAVVGDNCIIGANSLVTMRARIPSGVLALGSPAKVVRELTETELKEIQASARHYQELGKKYRMYFETSRS